LESLEIGDKFFWSWLPASGHSGGLLVSFRDSCFDVGVVSKGEFLISTKLVLKSSRFFFEFVGVYGPADHSRSPLFLQELEEVVTRATSPVLIAGDFNLIRGSTDKNNRNIDWSRVNLFNDSIARLQLREVVRSGARFTWTNKQLNPVRSVLDRVFISPQWETAFPLLSRAAEPSIGSDHTPLVFATGTDLVPRASRFFFENAWLSLLIRPFCITILYHNLLLFIDIFHI
jgi:hypothetical protein